MREVNPKNTSRATSYEYYIDAPALIIILGIKVRKSFSKSRHI